MARSLAVHARLLRLRAHADHSTLVARQRIQHFAVLARTLHEHISHPVLTDARVEYRRDVHKLATAAYAERAWLRLALRGLAMEFRVWQHRLVRAREAGLDDFAIQDADSDRRQVQCPDSLPLVLLPQPSAADTPVTRLLATMVAKTGSPEPSVRAAIANIDAAHPRAEAEAWSLVPALRELEAAATQEQAQVSSLARQLQGALASLSELVEAVEAKAATAKVLGARVEESRRLLGSDVNEIDRQLAISAQRDAAPTRTYTARQSRLPLPPVLAPDATPRGHSQGITRGPLNRVPTTRHRTARAPTQRAAAAPTPAPAPAPAPVDPQAEVDSVFAKAAIALAHDVSRHLLAGAPLTQVITSLTDTAREASLVDSHNTAYMATLEAPRPRARPPSRTLVARTRTSAPSIPSKRDPVAGITQSGLTVLLPSREPTELVLEGTTQAVLSRPTHRMSRVQADLPDAGSDSVASPRYDGVDALTSSR
jgi:hypothetical protein